MTNPDYRALCSEMLQAFDDYFRCPIDASFKPFAAARALLDQQPVSPPFKLPEPEGPTDEELLRIYGVATPCYHVEEYKRELDFARAVLDRWGRPTPQPVALFDIGQEWRPCVKLPITVHVRDQRPGETHSSTREGITPLRSDDLIMRGVRGEEYPIGRDLFEQTYELLPTPEATND